MKTRLIIIIFLTFSFSASAEEYISEELLSEIRETINIEYTIFEANNIHSKENDKITNLFFTILTNHTVMDQNELDKKALDIFKIIYDEINFGLLEDSNDFRRQSMRVAFCYSIIALCSKYDFNYYLNLANYSLYQSGNVNYEGLEEIYTIQNLVNIYIYNSKSSISDIRKSLSDYFKDSNSFYTQSAKLIEIEKLLERVQENLPPSNK